MTRIYTTQKQGQERILTILARNKGMPVKFLSIADSFRDLGGADDATSDATIKSRCRELLRQGWAVIAGGTDDNAMYRLTPSGVAQLPEALRPTPGQLSAGYVGAQVAAILAQRHRVSLADVFAQGQRERAQAAANWPSTSGPSVMVKAVKRQPPRPSRAKAERNNHNHPFGLPVINSKQGEADNLRSAQIRRQISIKTGVKS